jgi:hypothetical protein
VIGIDAEILAVSDAVWPSVRRVFRSRVARGAAAACLEVEGGGFAFAEAKELFVKLG